MLLLYDCARLGFVLAIVKDQMYVPLLTANALFPIAGFFLFDDPRKYREYGPLYIAGKAVVIFAGFVWLLVAPGKGDQFSFLPVSRANNTFLYYFVLAVLTVTDILSLLARLRLHRLLCKKEPLQPVEPFKSAGEIANCE
jgi:hypothetical protein